MNKYNIQWDLNGNEILFVNKKSLDQIMDSEDSAVIFTECEMLELIDSFINDSENELTEEMESKFLDFKDLIKEKIEKDVIKYAIPYLL